MSSSSNPRKFSEKIAIQQRKLNEEQSAFQQIMNEVHTITRLPTPMSIHTATGLGPPGQCFAPPTSWREHGSLPNVFEMAYHPQRPGGQGFEQMNYPVQWPGPSAGVAPHPSQISCHPHHAESLVHRGRSPGAHPPHYHPYRTPSPGHHASPGSGASPRGHSPERPQLTPPSQSNSYLVPPSDSGWRRTHSDPGIHASVTNPNLVAYASGAQQTYASPTPPQNNISPGVSPHADLSQVSGYLDPKGSFDANVIRPRSCENSPHMPTLSIHPSENVTGPQIPISNNTGSLPDLTQLPQAPMNADGSLPNQAPPPYATHMVGVGQQMTAGGVSQHQQRHSIQLPVQGNFQNFPYTTFTSQSGSPSYSQGSPGYQPESPHSGPNSPAAVGNPESPAASQQNQGSPGSPYYTLPAQLQNINIDSSDLSNPPYYTTNQQQFKMPPAPYQQQQQQQQHYGMSQQQGIPAAMMMYQQQQQQQQQQLRMLQQQQQQQQQQQIRQNIAIGQQQYMQQPLPSPNSGKIPNIILTGPNDSMNAAGVSMMSGHSSYVDDNTVEILSSDLRLTLDPSDLESLQVLSNEHNDFIDAASEDALRRDRI